MLFSYVGHHVVILTADVAFLVTPYYKIIYVLSDWIPSAIWLCYRNSPSYIQAEIATDLHRNRYGCASQSLRMYVAIATDVHRKRFGITTKMYCISIFSWIPKMATVLRLPMMMTSSEVFCISKLNTYLRTFWEVFLVGYEGVFREFVIALLHEGT